MGKEMAAQEEEEAQVVSLLWFDLKKKGNRRRGQTVDGKHQN